MLVREEPAAQIPILPFEQNVQVLSTDLLEPQHQDLTTIEQVLQDPIDIQDLVIHLEQIIIATVDLEYLLTREKLKQELHAVLQEQVHAIITTIEHDRAQTPSMEPRRDLDLLLARAFLRAEAEAQEAPFHQVGQHLQEEDKQL